IEQIKQASLEAKDELEEMDTEEEQNKILLASIKARPGTPTYARLLRMGTERLQKKIEYLVKRSNNFPISLLLFSLERLQLAEAAGLVINTVNVRLEAILNKMLRDSLVEAHAPPAIRDGQLEIVLAENINIPAGQKKKLEALIIKKLAQQSLRLQLIDGQGNVIEIPPEAITVRIASIHFIIDLSELITVDCRELKIINAAIGEEYFIKLNFVPGKVELKTGPADENWWEESFKKAQEPTPWGDEHIVPVEDRPGVIKIRITKEMLGDWNPDSPSGRNFLSSFLKYEKIGPLAIAGIRHAMNITNVHDTRALKNSFERLLTSLSLGLMVKIMYNKGAYFPYQTTYGHEVRYHSNTFQAITARTLAALGFICHVVPNNEATAIWNTATMGKFFNFPLSFCGTSSHSPSNTDGLKIMDYEGSQFLISSIEAMIAIQRAIIEKIQCNGYVDFYLSGEDDPRITSELYHLTHNGMYVYRKYQEKTAADEVVLGLVRSIDPARIHIDCAHGSVYRTLTAFFREMGLGDLIERIDWMHAEERADFGNIGKLSENPKSGKAELFDLGADGTQVQERVLENGEVVKYFPVLCTADYVERFMAMPAGDIILHTDMDNDRLFVSQVLANTQEVRDLLRDLGVVYNIVSSDKLVAVFIPNKFFHFLHEMNFQRLTTLMKKGTISKERTLVVLKTLASTPAVDKWAEKRKAEGWRIEVINTAVGFAKLANVMYRAEGMMRQRPGEDVVITDASGKDINIGPDPIILAAWEESGGIIVGITYGFKDLLENSFLAEREKSATESIFLSLALISKLQQGKSSVRLDFYLKELYDRDEIDTPIDIRFDNVLSLPGTSEEAKRKEEEGNKKKARIFGAYLAIVIAYMQHKISIEQAKGLLRDIFNQEYQARLKQQGPERLKDVFVGRFPKVDIDALVDIKFTGDGVMFIFEREKRKWFVLFRPSGTEPKLKAYGFGLDPERLTIDTWVFGFTENTAGNLPESFSANADLMNLWGNDGQKVLQKAQRMQNAWEDFGLVVDSLDPEDLSRLGVDMAGLEQRKLVRTFSPPDDHLERVNQWLSAEGLGAISIDLASPQAMPQSEIIVLLQAIPEEVYRKLGRTKDEVLAGEAPALLTQALSNLPEEVDVVINGDEATLTNRRTHKTLVIQRLEHFDYQYLRIGNLTYLVVGDSIDIAQINPLGNLAWFEFFGLTVNDIPAERYLIYLPIESQPEASGLRLFPANRVLHPRLLAAPASEASHTEALEVINRVHEQSQGSTSSSILEVLHAALIIGLGPESQDYYLAEDVLNHLLSSTTLSPAEQILITRIKDYLYLTYSGCDWYKWQVIQDTLKHPETTTATPASRPKTIYERRVESNRINVPGEKLGDWEVARAEALTDADLSFIPTASSDPAVQLGQEAIDKGEVVSVPFCGGAATTVKKTMGRNKLVHKALQVIVDKGGRRLKGWISILQARLGFILGQNIASRIVVVTSVGGTKEGESDRSTLETLNDHFGQQLRSGQIRVAIQRNGLVMDVQTGEPLRFADGSIATCAENHLWAFLAVLSDKDLVVDLLEHSNGILSAGNGDNVLNFVRAGMVGQILKARQEGRPVATVAICTPSAGDKKGGFAVKVTYRNKKTGQKITRIEFREVSEFPTRDKVATKFDGVDLAKEQGSDFFTRCEQNSWFIEDIFAGRKVAFNVAFYAVDLRLVIARIFGLDENDPELLKKLISIDSQAWVNRVIVLGQLIPRTEQPAKGVPNEDNSSKVTGYITEQAVQDLIVNALTFLSRGDSVPDVEILLAERKDVFLPYKGTPQSVIDRDGNVVNDPQTQKPIEAYDLVANQARYAGVTAELAARGHYCLLAEDEKVLEVLPTTDIEQIKQASLEAKDELEEMGVSLFEKIRRLILQQAGVGVVQEFSQRAYYDKTDRGAFRVQVNPERHPQRRAKLAIGKEGRYFLCPENQPPQETGISINGDWTIYANPNPYENGHFVLVKTAKAGQHPYQAIAELSDINTALSVLRELALTDGKRDYSITFNSIGAAASSAHFHFQGFEYRLPITGLKTAVLTEENGLAVGRISDADYPVSAYVVQGADEAAVANKLWELIQIIHANQARLMVGYNVLFTVDEAQDIFRVFIFLRPAEKPLVGGGLANVKMGICEVSGMAIVYGEDMAANISRKDFEDALQKTVMYSEDIEKLWLAASGKQDSSYPASMLITNEPDRAPTTEELGTILATFGGKDTLASQGVTLGSTSESYVNDARVVTVKDYKGRPGVNIGIFEADPSAMQIHILFADELVGKLLPVDRRTNRVEFRDPVTGERLDTMQDVRSKVPSIDELIRRFKLTHPDLSIVAISGNENLFYNEPIVTVCGERVYHAVGVDITGREYPMFVVWPDNRVSIEEHVTFKFSDNSRNRFIVFINNKEEKIHYATVIQLIRNEHGFVKPSRQAYFYDDVRHLFSLPGFRPEDKIGIPEGTMSGAVFFMADQLLANDRSKIKEYFESEDLRIMQDFQLKIMFVNQESSEEYRDVPADILAQKLLTIGYTPEDFIIDQERGIIRIHLRENIYPFHVVGLTQTGWVKEIAINGLSGRRGVSIREAAELAEEEGLVKAGIVDQGTTVRLDVGRLHLGNATVDNGDKQGLERATSVIVYTVKDKNLSYPASMPTSSKPDRAPREKEWNQIFPAFGGKDALAAHGISLDDTNVVMSPRLAAPAEVRGGVLYINPNTLRGPPEQLRVIFEGHELFHLLGMNEEEACLATTRYLLEHNLLGSHSAFLEKNNIGLIADNDWLLTLRLPYSPTTNTLKDVEKLISFLSQRETEQQAELIVVLGNSRLEAPEYAARLYREGYAKKILASGGIGRETPPLRENVRRSGRYSIENLDALSEAEIFRDILIANGVAPEDIIIEDQSTNTKENILNSKKILEEQNIPHQMVILIQHPLLQRRSVATFRRWFSDDVTCLSCPPALPYFYLASSEEQAVLINMALGEIGRFAIYGPEGKNDIVAVAIPAEVSAAYQALKSPNKPSSTIKRSLVPVAIILGLAAYGQGIISWIIVNPLLAVLIAEGILIVLILILGLGAWLYFDIIPHLVHPVEAYIGDLDSSDSDKFTRAVLKLGELGDRRAIPYLEERLADFYKNIYAPDYYFDIVLKSLSAIGGEEAIAVLKRFCDEVVASHNEKVASLEELDSEAKKIEIKSEQERMKQEQIRSTPAVVALLQKMDALLGRLSALETRLSEITITEYNVTDFDTWSGVGESYRYPNLGYEEEYRDISDEMSDKSQLKRSIESELDKLGFNQIENSIARLSSELHEIANRRRKLEQQVSKINLLIHSLEILIIEAFKTPGSYPATMPVSNRPNRAPGKRQWEKIFPAFGGADALAIRHISLDNNNVVISPSLAAPAEVRGGVLYINPNTLRGPPEQLRVIFEGHELFHLLGMDEDTARFSTLFYLLHNNLLENHLAFLKENDIHIIPDSEWFAFLTSASLLPGLNWGFYVFEIPESMVGGVADVAKGLPDLCILEPGDMAVISPGVVHQVLVVDGPYEHVAVQVPATYQYGVWFKEELDYNRSASLSDFSGIVDLARNILEKSTGGVWPLFPDKDQRNIAKGRGISHPEVNDDIKQAGRAWVYGNVPQIKLSDDQDYLDERDAENAYIEEALRITANRGPPGLADFIRERLHIVAVTPHSSIPFLLSFEDKTHLQVLHSGLAREAIYIPKALYEVIKEAPEILASALVHDGYELQQWIIAYEEAKGHGFKGSISDFRNIHVSLAALIHVQAQKYEESIAGRSLDNVINELIDDYYRRVNYRDPEPEVVELIHILFEHHRGILENYMSQVLGVRGVAIRGIRQIYFVGKGAIKRVYRVSFDTDRGHHALGIRFIRNEDIENISLAKREVALFNYFYALDPDIAIQIREYWDMDKLLRGAPAEVAERMRVLVRGLGFLGVTFGEFMHGFTLDKL
ncbi:MAG: DUF4922 domain-containing protein, partial [bacterium]